MAFDANSRIRDLMANEQAKAIIDKHIPGASTHPQLYMAMDMSLKEVSWYPESGLTPKKLEALLEDLAKI